MTIEPLLALDEIQGIVAPGFFKPHQALLCVKLSSDRSKRARVIGELREMLERGRFATGRQALWDRVRHRQALRPDAASPLVAIAFSSAGLEQLCAGLSATVTDSAFQAGMPARAGLLGDPDPNGWRVGAPDKTLHLMVVIAGDTQPSVRELANRLDAALTLGDKMLRPAEPQFGDLLPAPLAGREHFGFADGISQPGIRGRAGTDPDVYITDRRLPRDDPEHALFGYPGQHLVWPGELVLGYPASSPDPLIPGPVREVPAWMHNGSFLVYRRLRQNVAAFRHTMADEAERLRGQPGFRGLTAERLAAMLVGRWPSGAPVSRAPLHDCPALGANAMLNNDFRFDDDTPDRTGLPDPLRGFARARADVIGQVCPVASHIRKVNLRDQASDVGGASATQTRRLLRVGVPYGDPLPEMGPHHPDDDRGLLFLSIQASIEDQFEFLQARWINSRSRPRGPGGNDMVVGQNSAMHDGERRSLVFGANLANAEVVAKESFVTMTGGGYFFVPSLSTLRTLLSSASP